MFEHFVFRESHYQKRTKRVETTQTFQPELYLHLFSNAADRENSEEQSQKSGTSWPQGNVEAIIVEALLFLATVEIVLIVQVEENISCTYAAHCKNGTKDVTFITKDVIYIT